MNRMQERTAVNIEVIRECLKNGPTGYEAAIEKLKERNRNYYNYFRKLCCINGKVNSQQDAEQIISILMRTATIALNVNPELIINEKMEVLRSLYALGKLSDIYDIHVYLHKEIPFIRFELTDSLMVLTFLTQ